MSRIPIIRDLYKEKLFLRNSDEEPEINAYYEGFLSEEDAREISGIDFAMLEAEAAFIYDLQDIDGFASTSFDVSKIDVEALEKFAHNEEYDPFENGDEAELSRLSNETKIIMLIYSRVFSAIENGRNMRGVSMIESMSDEERDKNESEFLEGNYKNALIRLKEV